MNGHKDQNFVRDSRLDDHWTELRRHLASTEQRVGQAPTEGEVRKALGADPGELTLDRWLFGWEHGQAGRVDAIPERGRRHDWYIPVDQPCGVVLTPTASPWVAPGLLDFFGAETQAELPFFLALLQRWHLRWGGEVVASFGTMLEFIVERPLSAPDDLIDLAVEHYAIAPCTLQLPGISLRDYASRLSGSTSPGRADSTGGSGTSSRTPPIPWVANRERKEDGCVLLPLTVRGVG